MSAYLVHLEKPWIVARHYIGFTDRHVEKGPYENTHLSPLLDFMDKDGIGLSITRVWEDEKKCRALLMRPRDERSLVATSLCPNCTQHPAEII